MKYLTLHFSKQYKELIFGLGWYESENFGFCIEIFEHLKNISFTVINIKIFKFCFSIIINLDKEDKEDK